MIFNEGPNHANQANENEIEMQIEAEQPSNYSTSQTRLVGFRLQSVSETSNSMAVQRMTSIA